MSWSACKHSYGLANECAWITAAVAALWCVFFFTICFHFSALCSFYPFELLCRSHRMHARFGCHRYWYYTYTHTYSFLCVASFAVHPPRSRCLLGMFSLATLNWAWIPSVVSSYFFSCTYTMFNGCNASAVRTPDFSFCDFVLILSRFVHTDRSVSI